MRNRNKVFSGVRRALVCELKQHVEPEYRRGVLKYIKEGIVLHGVRLPIVRDVSAKYYKEISKHGKDGVLAFCDSLVRSNYAEEKTVAFDWAYRLRKCYDPRDFRRFEPWLREHVSNWGSCDDFCRHAFGAFAYQFPQFLPHISRWTSSRNRWLRRGAAVTMIYSLRKGRHLDAALRIADALLEDGDYLVQNGYGWMLKDASILFKDEVFDYIMLNKGRLPRRPLRYAIERMNPLRKKKAME
jgi:3-methyladenine DNA glycosylase AlkD